MANPTDSVFGEAGDKPGQFGSPSDVAFDSDGNVKVHFLSTCITPVL